jgi:hypothetical protein
MRSPKDTDQLALDLARFPDSSTLNSMALRDDSGAVVGMAVGLGSLLEWAYFCGRADAELIVRAEHLAAFIGSFGDRGHHHRAVRLSHAVHATNRRLGAHALGALTVLAPVDWPAMDIHSRTAESTGSIVSECLYEARAGHDPPPPLDAAATAPHRPCAPPTSLTRGFEWLSRVGTVGTNRKGIRIVPLAA